MKVSNRIKNMEYPAIRSLSPSEIIALEKGRNIHYLNIGSPDIETPKEYFNAVRNYDIKILGYEASNGMHILKQATSKYFNKQGIDIEEDDIVITQGASEALIFLMLVLADEGDEIITCNPFFSCYKTFFDQTGVNIRTFETYPDNQYSLPSREIIEKEINSRTKAILLANPGNPTGAVYTKEEIRMIIDIAIERELFIIADEVYREYVYDNEKFTSFGEFKDIEDRLIITDSISKRFSACGARIGAIVTKNKEIIYEVGKLATGRNSVATLEQVGAAALYNVNDKYYKNIRESYRTRRNTIFKGLSNIEGVQVIKPKGAFYIMASLPIKNAFKFSKWILEEFHINNETVMVAPGSGFYYKSKNGDNQIRMAYVIEDEKIERAVNILEKGLQEYIKKFPKEVI